MARTALVLTISDSVAAGVRDDASGAAVAARLAERGWDVERGSVADDRLAIAAALRRAAGQHPLVVSTGGTGLTPRDVTPEATGDVLDFEIPGIAEAMRAAGRRSTPLADLSRAKTGVIGRSLVINLPGSPRGALESLDAVVVLLDHAVQTLAGPYDHDVAGQGPGPAAGHPDPREDS
jgi:molybdenum cofactor synthesis domain-containing protein